MGSVMVVIVDKKRREKLEEMNGHGQEGKGSLGEWEGRW